MNLAIALTAKGSVNNLHRPEIVAAFRRQGITPHFLVPDDYIDLLPKLKDAGYRPVRWHVPPNRLEFWREAFRYLRRLYPAREIALRQQFRWQNRARKRLPRRIYHRGLQALARYRFVMEALVRLEAGLFRHPVAPELEAGQFDQLLIQGIGAHNAEFSGLLTWWAFRHEKSVIHLIGNYDHLSSKGFRGHQVDTLLVWGPTMRSDAIHLQGLPADRIRMIGAPLYDRIEERIVHDRRTFFTKCRLAENKKTILFAGPLSAYHYFEMVQVFEKMVARDPSLQLILRLYPDRAFMADAALKPLIYYADQHPHIYVSLGAPPDRRASMLPETLEIETEELWPALKYSDVVVNFYSTIALEACLFDKPAVYMVYFPASGYAWHRPPVYMDYGWFLHNRRMVDYGIFPLAHNQEDLARLIEEALARPERHQEKRRAIVLQEMGNLDGRVADRLAEACRQGWQQHPHRPPSAE